MSELGGGEAAGRQEKRDATILFSLSHCNYSDVNF